MNLLAFFLFIFTLPLSAQEVFTLGQIDIADDDQTYSDYRGASTIDTKSFSSRNFNDSSKMISQIPGVTLSASGARNERTVMVRGFDLRQVPLLVDGIAVSLPYDGYVDLGRFMTGDIAAVQVSKGFSSSTLGPNVLGGAINLVSQQPQKPLEVEFGAGASFDNEFDKNESRMNFRIAGKQKYFYYQLFALKDMQQNVRASSSYDGDQVVDHSHRADQKLSLKIGITPSEGHEYSFSVIEQQGEKEVPTYEGDLSSIQKRYWNYPVWDKRSYYFISKSKVSSNTTIKTRVYWDFLKNTLKSYDNASYSSQNAGYAFTSFYDDDILGGQIELNQKVADLLLKSVFHVKRDHHRENNDEEPVRHFIDQTYSLGLEGTKTLSTKFDLVVGASYDWRESKRAENYNSTTDVITDYDANDNQALNPMTGIVFRQNDWVTWHTNISKRTRFPTMKDRYSYRLGKSLPNPDLREEKSLVYELGSKVNLSDRTEIVANVFYYDVDDTLMSVNISPTKTQMQNTGKSTTSGVELSATHTISPFLTLLSDYSYIRKVDQSSQKLLFADLPRQHAKLTSKVNFNDRVALLLSAEAYSKRYSDTAGLQVTRGFYLLDTSVDYRLNEHIMVDLGISNLLDRDYQLTEGYPESGRKYYINGKMRF